MRTPSHKVSSPPPFDEGDAIEDDPADLGTAFGLDMSLSDSLFEETMDDDEAPMAWLGRPLRPE